MKTIEQIRRESVKQLLDITNDILEEGVKINITQYNTLLQELRSPDRETNFMAMLCIMNLDFEVNKDLFEDYELLVSLLIKMVNFSYDEDKKLCIQLLMRKIKNYERNRRKDKSG